MGDQYSFLPQLPGSNLPVQVEVHPDHPTERSEVPNRRDPCLPGSLLWQYPANVFSQVRLELTGALIVPDFH